MLAVKMLIRAHLSRHDLMDPCTSIDYKIGEYSNIQEYVYVYIERTCCKPRGENIIRRIRETSPQ